MSRKQDILDITEDLVGRFVYYDRKECETLPMGQLEEAVAVGEITVDEIIEKFSTELRKNFK